MRTNARTVLAAVTLLALAAAAPVAVAPEWGWLITGAVALAGGVGVAFYVRRRVLRPIEQAAQSIGADEPSRMRTGDLARLVVSEHRNAVARISELTSANDRQRTALAHTTDGVVFVGADGYVQYANPVARRLIHDRVLDVTRRIPQPELDALVVRACGESRPASEDLTLRLPEARRVGARAIPLADGSCVLLLEDRTESERLDRMRRDFVANVSHELKTPVASIHALAEVARSALDDDPQAARRFVARLEEETERLGRLVGDLLDLSKVEAGGGTVERRPVDLRSLLEDAATRAQSLAEREGVTFEIEGEPVTVPADGAQLAMAVGNLVDNAVRYSDGGTVRLAVERRDGEVAVTVADQGIGIPSDELGRIFERFYRVDRARSRATGGTGLGLSIVRHVAENHGGRVEVRSELGLGSTFTLSLPAEAPKREGHAA